MTVMMCVITAAQVSSAGVVRYILTADRNTAEPGETINYKVSLGACEHIQATQVSLDIPEGLIYLSGKPADGITQTLGAAMADYADAGKTFASIGLGDYSSDEETLLFTFSCKVADTVKNGDRLKVGVVLTEAVNPDDEILESVFDNDDAVVTVTGASSSGGSSSSGGFDSSSGSGSSGEGGSASAIAGEGGGSQSGGTSSAQEETDENGNLIVIAPDSAQDGTSASTADRIATDNQAKGGISPWIFVVIGVAAAMAVFVALYFYIGNKNKKKENQSG